MNNNDNGMNTVYNSQNSSSSIHNSNYSRLMEKQVYRDNNAYKEENNKAFESNSAYSDKQRIKLARFNDLKILNENLINLSNNLIKNESPLTILSQREKGEVKNILGKRVFVISFTTAFVSLLFACVIFFSNHSLVIMAFFAFYIFIIGRTFYYPAKLYYENIQFITNKHATLYFEEMDYWWKLSVANMIMALLISSIALLYVATFEYDIVYYLTELVKSKNNNLHLINYISHLSFSTGFTYLAIFNFLIIIMYFKFINKEKAISLQEQEERIKASRNETLSRVQQIRADKQI